MRKDSRIWQPEPDDLEFELKSNCFLTGISDHMPSADVRPPNLIPARHGVESPNVDMLYWEVSNLQMSSRILVMKLG